MDRLTPDTHPDHPAVLRWQALPGRGLPGHRRAVPADVAAALRRADALLRERARRAGGGR
jgi:hypothetical protein